MADRPATRDDAASADRAQPPRRRDHLLRGARLAALPAAAWYGVLLATGYVVTGPLRDELAGWERPFVQGIAADRTPSWDDLTHVVSWSANTGTIVVAVLLLGLAVRAWLGRWLEAVTLWAGVALQSTIFLLTTLVVSRPRPEIEHLDPAPPTSSFPSGHTGASTALFVGLALLVADRQPTRARKVVVIVLMLVPPLLVAGARLYRGMHFPTDVGFGLLNGTAAVLIVRFAVYRDNEPARDAKMTAGAPE